MRTRNSSLAITLAILILCPATLPAGWLLEDQDGSVTVLAAGTIRYFEEKGTEASVAVDYQEDTITLVDAERRVYAAGSIDDYCTVMASVLKAFDEMDGILGDGQAEPAAAVEIVKAGAEEIAGFTADKYQVLVDGELYEERWITSDSRLLAELGDLDRHRRFMACLEEEGGEVEDSPAYRELNSVGWELRSISYDFGEQEYNSDIVVASETGSGGRPITPPAGYRQMTFEQLFFGETDQ